MRRAGAVLPIGPDLQYAKERPWDPLSFEVYLGNEGISDIELTDDQRHLRFHLTVEDRIVLLEGGSLDYAPIVRIHRPGSVPIDSNLGESVELT